MLSVISYHTPEGKQAVEKILSRSQLESPGVQETVDRILADVKNKGDEALFGYTKEFDHITLTKETIRVSEAEIEAAYQKVSPELVQVIRQAAERIRAFHEKQKQNSWFDTKPNGEILGQLIRPLARVGVYVPGGKAAYPSSVLMNVMPAHVAGVEEIIMTTPAQKDGSVYPTTIVAAKEAGVTAIYKVGGAQAIAALAYGTSSVPKVDKICGPGNIFVALAKRTVYGHVNIDSVAGPSEILVLADKTARADYVAADLLSQAEHDPMASAIAITDDADLAQAIAKEVEAQTAVLERKEIIETSLKDFGAIILVDDMNEAVEIANGIAPEHMEISTAEPFSLLPKVKNAGAVFLGHFSPEPLGDYMAGPNHVLPTGGTARFFSPLSVDDFVKKSSIISFSKEALLPLSDSIIAFANAEGLTAHANAVRIRK
ncbi:MAG TPA: histidinol dehydrogenase [Firmicutes bacterium]|nr:histidinol dehydrogenase [Bacillota bacterium]